ncbi:MAG: hypothetical protein JXX28_03115 [Deltaproteobacteria bacterium]|nr:hypothetical protein [Deltaproteobacteria bacterium]
MSLSTLAEQVVVILVEPQQAGNVGSAARALKNMGLRRLTIVNPPSFDPERARWMAPGCDDILAEMRITATLDEALEGVHRAVAATARHRRGTQGVYTPAELSRQVVESPEGHVTAILFGREDFGLSKEHTERCESILRIPTPEHASLNLSQAVMVVANHLFEAARATGEAAPGRPLGGRRRAKSTQDLDRRSRAEEPADLVAMEPVVEELVSLLDRVGYTRATGPAKVALSAREALQTARPTPRQLGAFRGMIARIQWALDHPDADWLASKRTQP